MGTIDTVIRMSRMNRFHIPIMSLTVMLAPHVLGWCNNNH